MMRIICSVLVVLAVLTSCDRVKKKVEQKIDQKADKVNHVLNRAGEVVGHGSSEFVEGVSKGVGEKYKCSFRFEDKDKFSEVEFGRYMIENGSQASNNVLSLYMIFNENFDADFIVKVIDREGLEYGRTRISLQKMAGDAGYVSIEFDSKVELESMSTFEFE